MGYLHIGNLYKAKEILLFRECYALEKVHGTSAHLRFRVPWDGEKERVTYFAGGVKQDAFEACFDKPAMEARAREIGGPGLTVYGEAYGAKCQAMRHTYGPDLRFIAFDVTTGARGDARWCDVPEAERIANALGFEFVPYRRVSTDIDSLNAERDRPSEVAVRRGMGDRPREGVVLRPLVEVTLADGSRVIAKHKGEAFSELARTPKVRHDGKLEVLRAREAAEQWVTPLRLRHMSDRLAGRLLRAGYKGGFPLGIEVTGAVIEEMLEDVHREGEGEVVFDRDTDKAIAARTAMMWKQACKERNEARLL